MSRSPGHRGCLTLDNFFGKREPGPEDLTSTPSTDMGTYPEPMGSFWFAAGLQAGPAPPTTPLPFVLRNPRSLLQGARPDEGTLAEVREWNLPPLPSPSLQMSQAIFSSNRAASQPQTPHRPRAELPVFMQLKH